MAIGIIATALVGSCALIVGGGALISAPQNKEIAIHATRELAKSWNVNDVRPFFASSAIRQINFDRAQTTIDPFKPLGQLKSVERANQTEFRINKNTGKATTKTATVVLEATFEN